VPLQRPQELLTQVEDAITEDFVALLVARNRCGPALPIEELLHRNAIPLEVFSQLLTSPTFTARVRALVQELTAAGFGVEAKSAVLHEAGLPIVYEILADPAQPALARLKAHEILGTVSGKADRFKSATAPGNGATLNLNGAGGTYQLVINLGPAAPQQTLRGVTPQEVQKLVYEAAATPVPPEDVIDPDYAP
jgi:hypothetical protein